MKAREIKKFMIMRYEVLIQRYERAKEEVKNREADIRIMQDDLKMYFNVTKSYNFGLGEQIEEDSDVPF